METTIEMKPAARPRSYHYASGLRWTEEKRGILAAIGKPRLDVAAPPEFKGHEGVWSPEDLLVAAVHSCTMMTFLSLAARKGLGLVSYESEATGTLELEGGEFRFTRIVIRPRIGVAVEADRSKALVLFQEAEDRCLVANSLLTMVEGEPEVQVMSSGALSHSKALA